MLQIRQTWSNQATQEEILAFRSVANRTFGCDYVTEDYFKAKYLDNIYGPSVLFLAYWDGQPVGARACWRNDLNGMEAYASADSSVLPSFQGKGVFRAILEKTAAFAAENPQVILYGFPNNNSSPVYKKLGWTVKQLYKKAVYPGFSSRSKIPRIDSEYALWWMKRRRNICHIKRFGVWYLVKQAAKPGRGVILGSVSREAALHFPKANSFLWRLFCYIDTKCPQDSHGQVNAAFYNCPDPNAPWYKVDAL
ncbi:MAG: GNAT family N-acetyltransferase [Bacteroidales bacterium]|nr:GNAT family N-acetyltransferase [Bacteroidales bacterium]